MIAIIRTEDDPKAVMIAEFAADRRAGRGDPQHAAAQPAQARGDGDPHRAGRADRWSGPGWRRSSRTRGRSGRASPRSCARCARPSARMRRAARGGPRSTTRRRWRRSSYEAMIEREPVTVVCSEMGWIRAMKGHLAPDAEHQVQGRRRAAVLPARGDDRPAAAVRLERADVHAGLRRAARRARHGRAGAADDRPAQRGADAGALRARAGRAAAGGLARRGTASSCPRTRRWRRPGPGGRC